MAGVYAHKIPCFGGGGYFGLLGGGGGQCQLDFIFMGIFLKDRGFTKGWFSKGRFSKCSPGGPRNENRNEGTFGCSPGTKTGTRVRSHFLPERRPEGGYIRHNHPFTKLPFCLPVIDRCKEWIGQSTVGAEMVAEFICRFVAEVCISNGKYPPPEMFPEQRQD